LQRGEHVRGRRTFREPRLDDGVDSSVGQARGVSVPRCGHRHSHADDLLPLVVPRVELELGVLGDHAAEEAFENGVVVEELGPHRTLGEARRVWEVAGLLGTSRKQERHLRERLTRGRATSHARPRLSGMWDVLTWHDGTLAIAWWAVIVLIVALLSIGGS